MKWLRFWILRIERGRAGWRGLVFGRWVGHRPTHHYSLFPFTRSPLGRWVAEGRWGLGLGRGHAGNRGVVFHLVEAAVDAGVEPEFRGVAGLHGLGGAQHEAFALGVAQDGAAFGLHAHEVEDEAFVLLRVVPGEAGAAHDELPLGAERVFGTVGHVEEFLDDGQLHGALFEGGGAHGDVAEFGAHVCRDGEAVFARGEGAFFSLKGAFDGGAQGHQAAEVHGAAALEQVAHNVGHVGEDGDDVAFGVGATARDHGIGHFAEGGGVGGDVGGVGFLAFEFGGAAVPVHGVADALGGRARGELDVGGSHDCSPFFFGGLEGWRGGRMAAIWRRSPSPAFHAFKPPMGKTRRPLGQTQGESRSAFPLRLARLPETHGAPLRNTRHISRADGIIHRLSKRYSPAMPAD